MSISAVVLAGDQEASKKILGKNKAFLQMSGKPILYHVLAALDEARQINRMVLVGPKAQIEAHLKNWHFNTPVTVIEQKINVYENAWSGFLHSLPNYLEEIPEKVYEKEYLNQPALFVAADIPVVVGPEIDQFISSADLTNYDVVLGMTNENLMKKYHPTRIRPGIHMTFFHLKEFSIRQSNMILVKPFQVKNKAYFRLMYTMRHQKNFLQMVKLGWTLMRLPEGSLKIMGDYILLHLNMAVSLADLHFLLNRTRKLVPIERICRHISALIGARFTVLENHLGGAALDTDNDKDYYTMSHMFKIWKAEQRRLGEKLSSSRRSLRSPAGVRTPPEVLS